MTPPHKVYEGVFAIHKPQGITSAAAIRDVQARFKDSETFKPWFEQEQKKRDVESYNQHQKRRGRNRVLKDVKIGHGGTLDPLATGVLILGVGTGTKRLGDFLGCTKDYECVVLFGAETDTYDVEGKIVGRKGWEGVTKEKVQKALEGYKGEIMQKPPIYSALKVQGKKLLDYALEGKEVPIEIKARPVDVHKMELVEWMEGGSHGYRWPTKEAEEQQKAVIEKVQKKLDEGEEAPPAKRRKTGPSEEKAETENKPAVKSPNRNNEPADAEPQVEEGPCPAPACRLRMRVGSGFYVRSLCHDLGQAVGSLALMSSLVRSRQGDFALETDKVLPYEDLGKGEEVWGPKVKQMLEEWQSKDEASGKEDRSNDHDSRLQPKQKAGGRRRRNSSSSESS